MNPRSSLLHLAASCLALASLAGCAWDPSRPVRSRRARGSRRRSPISTPGTPRRAASRLEDYLSTGACKDGIIGTPDLLKRRADGTFDLGLALFRIGEQFGRRFGEEEVDAGVTEAVRAQAPRADRVRASRRRRPSPRTTAVPGELRARAHYLSGNLAFLDGAYERRRDGVRPRPRPGAGRGRQRAIRSDATRHGTARSRSAASRTRRTPGPTRRRRETPAPTPRANPTGEVGRMLPETRAGPTAARPRAAMTAGRTPSRRRRPRPTRVPSLPGGRRPASAEHRRRRADARPARERAHAAAGGGQARGQEARARDGGQMSPARLGRAMLLIALAILWSPFARAQSAPQIQVQIDEDTVGVGDVVTVVMNATSAESMPGDPRVGSTPGFAVRGQSESPSQTHIIINGNRIGPLRADRRVDTPGAARRHVHRRPAQRRARGHALRRTGVQAPRRPGRSGAAASSAAFADAAEPLRVLAVRSVEGADARARQPRPDAVPAARAHHRPEARARSRRAAASTSCTRRSTRPARWSASRSPSASTSTST